MKLDITAIDKNFLIGTQIDQNGLIWLDILNRPFEIRGLAVHEGERFERIPAETASKVSDGVKMLSTHTAGGRVRFATDSARIAIRCESLYSGSMSHMPLSGSMGLDVYVNGVFKASIRPNNDDGGMFEGVFMPSPGMNEIEINMPLYNGIKRMFVGLNENAELTAPKPYAIEKPIVYYGSSITQGGCASRPGNSYEGFISRWLDCDYINLGYSGNGKGEVAMAEYIAGLNMTAFVMDYDHNAPNPEHLEVTHERFYSIIRKAQPELPILIVTKPDCDKDLESAARRRAVIRKTYDNALMAGDSHVAFLDGYECFGREDRDACTVDGTHPNDLGFYRMAQALYAKLSEIIAQ